MRRLGVLILGLAIVGFVRADSIDSEVKLGGQSADCYLPIHAEHKNWGYRYSRPSVEIVQSTEDSDLQLKVGIMAEILLCERPFRWRQVAAKRSFKFLLQNTYVPEWKFWKSREFRAPFEQEEQDSEILYSATTNVPLNDVLTRSEFKNWNRVDPLQRTLRLFLYDGSKICGEYVRTHCRQSTGYFDLSFEMTEHGVSNIQIVHAR